MIMKISKLFHWLYAVLMFLPLVMFLPSCLYYSLNKYATNETTTQVNYKYQSNNVNSLDDLVLGNLYHLDSLNIQYQQDTTLNFGLNIVSGLFEDFEYTNDPLYDYDFTNYEILGNLFLSIDSDNLYIQFQNNSLVAISFNYVNISDVIFSISFQNDDSFNDYLVHNDFLPEYTDFNVIESVETNVQDTISNKMYLAWESIWNLPLFAWTKNSFVSAPFTYITGLFGVSATNSLNYVFTYFVSISICWLVFDLLMYVPNLAHRWLDKGAIE